MGISKKIRFEVFKRDGFACCYCGKTPPQAVLEVDHIEPKSKGGKDEINNLITACFDCNRGKSGIPLDKLPNTLTENLEILKEKEAQLKQHRKFTKLIQKRIDSDIDTIQDVFKEYFGDLIFTDQFRNGTVKRFIENLPLHEIADAMHIAGSRKKDADGCIKYFCGICWNKIKADDPDKKIVTLWLRLGYKYTGKQLHFEKRDLSWLAKIDLSIIEKSMHEVLLYNPKGGWGLWRDFTKDVLAREYETKNG